LRADVGTKTDSITFTKGGAAAKSDDPPRQPTPSGIFVTAFTASSDAAKPPAHIRQRGHPPGGLCCARDGKSFELKSRTTCLWVLGGKSGPLGGKSKFRQTVIGTSLIKNHRFGLLLYTGEPASRAAMNIRQTKPRPPHSRSPSTPSLQNAGTHKAAEKSRRQKYPLGKFAEVCRINQAGGRDEPRDNDRGEDYVRELATSRFNAWPQSISTLL